MTAVERNPITFEELRGLAREEGPCLTLLLSPHHPGSGTRPVAVRLRAMLADADSNLSQRGVLPTDRDSILAPLRKLLEDAEFHSGNTESFALFRNPRLLVQTRLPWMVTDQVLVEGRFALTPLLERIHSPFDFYLLALSRNRVRLLDCGWQRCEEMAPPEGMPLNLDDFLALDQSDNNRQLNRSPGGATFGEAAEREKLPQRLHDFCVAIDRAISGKIAQDHRPLVIAGAATEVSTYRAASNCPMLVEESVITSPDGGLTDRELRERAREALSGWRSQQERNAYRMYESLAGSRVLTDTAAVARAAFDGRVEHLFFQPGAAERGDYDRITERTQLAGSFLSDGDDLVNAAAVDTLRNSGHAWAGSPAGTALTAVLRY
jgi:hypothetical protein